MILDNEDKEWKKILRVTIMMTFNQGETFLLCNGVKMFASRFVMRAFSGFYPVIILEMNLQVLGMGA